MVCSPIGSVRWWYDTNSHSGNMLLQKGSHGQLDYIRQFLLMKNAILHDYYNIAGKEKKILKAFSLLTWVWMYRGNVVIHITVNTQIAHSPCV